MKNICNASAFVSQALYLRNASKVLDDIDEEVHDTLMRLLQAEVSRLEDWTCDDDTFGPSNWHDEEEGWLVSFELTCLGNALSCNWLLSAARQQDLCVAIKFEISDAAPRPHLLRLEVESALESLEKKIPGLERRFSRWGDRVVVIPLTGLSLEDLAESSSCWEDALKAPLHGAVARAVQFQKAVKSLIDSRIG